MYLPRILLSNARTVNTLSAVRFRSLHATTRVFLKHASSSKGGSEGRDMGKGNAAPDPELPSKRRTGPSSTKTPGGIESGKRKLHTSTVARSGANSDKTFRVDGTSEATHRPNQQWDDPKEEYATVSKDEPYEPPVETNNGEKPEQLDQKLRYGNTKQDATRNAPKGDEGPQAKDAGGLKAGGQVEV